MTDDEIEKFNKTEQMYQLLMEQLRKMPLHFGIQAMMLIIVTHFKNSKEDLYAYFSTFYDMIKNYEDKNT